MGAEESRHGSTEEKIYRIYNRVDNNQKLIISFSYNEPIGKTER